MKILHIITGLGSGGAEAVLSRLVIADNNSNEHHVISLTGRGIYGDRLEPFVASLHSLNFRRGTSLLLGFLKLLVILRKIHPDVVQTWMYHADFIGGIAARLTGIRSIVWGIRHANLEKKYNSAATLYIVRLCARLSGYLPKRIISCSVHALQLHKSVGYCAEKFVHIPNGYDLKSFKPDANGRYAVRTEFCVAPNVFVLGMVARFDSQKDHRNLILALSRLKRLGIDYICLLAGVNMDDANIALRSLIDESDISDKVKLLGIRSDVPSVMSALDVHVLSSLGEAFPNVLAEAMACETPCVATDVGDARLIVSNYGWIVARQDDLALANGLMQAYESFRVNQVEWQRRKSACRTHIMTNFELETMSERYRQVWKDSMELSG